jgi:hypothetical protein
MPLSTKRRQRISSAALMLEQKQKNCGRKSLAGLQDIAVGEKMSLEAGSDGEHNR